MYTNYKQQYAFGFGPVDLTGQSLSTSDKLYLGTEVGAKSTLALAKMIDLKADKQMAYEKALLSIRVLDAMKMGAKQKITITVSGTATADGTVKFEGFGEEADITATVTYSETSSAADVAELLADELKALKTWDVSVASAVITLERKNQLANITVNSTNFAITASVTGTTVGDATSVTAGSANDAVVGLTLVTCGVTAEGAADTDNVKKLATVYVDCADNYCSYEPYEEITFPKGAKEFVGFMVDSDKEATFTAGKILIHFNPFI